MVGKTAVTFCRGVRMKGWEASRTPEAGPGSGSLERSCSSSGGLGDTLRTASA